MKNIAVVILNWNGAKLLEKFLPSIIEFSPQATIYVADNASTDNSIEIIKQQFLEVKIIKNPKNLGYAGGYNHALKQIKATFYALVNSDVEVTQNWLEPILENFKNEPQTAIIQPKILDYNNKNTFEYAGAAGGFIDKYGFAYCRGRVFDTIEKDLGQYNDFSNIFWASGACFFIRSSVFNKLKGFDADFFAHQEEIDLCWRAFNCGYQVKYNYQSVIYHVGGATLTQSNPQKTYLNFRNSLLMLTKNLHYSMLFQTLFVRLFLDGIAGLRFLFQRKFSHFWAILRAHFSFYGLFLRNWKKRKKFYPRKYFSQKSIVYLYYVKRVKKNYII